jgi:hypothetical protein
MKVFVHIGLPKTGTTFLQSRLWHHREMLVRHGIYYPVTGTGATPGLQGGNRNGDHCMSHNWLAMALLPHRWGEFDASVQAAMPHLWLRLESELSTTPCSVALLSSEAFSWHLSTEEHVLAVRDRLAHHDVTIVYCERKPHDFIASMYGELLRVGRGPYSIDAFLNEFPQMWDTEHQRNRWGVVFGQNNFVTLRYDALSGPDMLQKYLGSILPDHPVTRAEYSAPTKERVHTSLSPRCLRFMEELHANRISQQTKTAFIELYKTLPDDYSPISSILASPADIDAALTRSGKPPLPSP